jgi:hypothetical protein
LYNVDPFFIRLPIQEITKKESQEIHDLIKKGKFLFIKPGDISFERFIFEQESGKL